MMDLSDKSLGVTAMDVKALRDISGWCLMDCKRYLMKKALREGIEQAKDIEDLRNGMLRIMEMMAVRA